LSTFWRAFWCNHPLRGDFFVVEFWRLDAVHGVWDTFWRHIGCIRHFLTLYWKGREREQPVLPKQAGALCAVSYLLVHACLNWKACADVFKYDHFWLAAFWCMYVRSWAGLMATATLPKTAYVYIWTMIFGWKDVPFLFCNLSNSKRAQQAQRTSFCCDICFATCFLICHNHFDKCLSWRFFRNCVCVSLLPTDCGSFRSLSPCF
jgi:hypothetical protein